MVENAAQEARDDVERVMEIPLEIPARELDMKPFGCMLGDPAQQLAVEGPRGASTRRASKKGRQARVLLVCSMASVASSARRIMARRIMARRSVRSPASFVI